ncbi:hypothetical protein [Parasitella parasitica]|uniref:Uncharacterized protein n=1 Tax=Parasitella parasitica TaxID=35722 RepID=A0A0B7MWD3_9FUNG|nr:hypothetical protein [Parasitella parasitica]
MEPESSNPAASLLLKKAKKSYSFYPPNVTPSVSTNKPRINGDDAKKLNDYFVAVIGPHSSDETLDCTRQDYELNITFDLLDFCLNGTLNNLLDCMDDIKANLGDNDDDRQDIRLLRYVLSDYHANCSKPSYIVIPNEHTPFAEYIIPILKYFSASTKSLSFIWCEKGSPSNKQLMLCLSESQRKLLDGIGLSCKDKVERVMMECSGYV